jgi:type IV pilus assembly protein PilA
LSIRKKGGEKVKMKRLMKGFGRGEKGVTLIELLIVIAILGIIAAVIVLNVGGFMGAGTLNAANTEAANVKTAAIAYYVEQSPPAWPDTSDDLVGLGYYSGTIKATYDFDDTGWIVDTTTVPGDWGDAIEWIEADQMWAKVTP